MDQKPKVLLVDDEERFRITTSKLLGVRGFETLPVGNAKEALDELWRTDYDVVVLDVRMPGMSGIEALAEIKRIRPGVEVIILTGHASVDAAVEIMRLGGYEYLLKPCPIDDLVEKIEAAFERKLSREGGACQTGQDGKA
jgi:DNA-binding NtrC family response regulator